MVKADVVAEVPGRGTAPAQLALYQILVINLKLICLPPFDKDYRLLFPSILLLFDLQPVVILLFCPMGKKKVKLPPTDPKEFRRFFNYCVF